MKSSTTYFLAGFVTFLFVIANAAGPLSGTVCGYLVSAFFGFFMGHFLVMGFIVKHRAK
jgi:hypothetical protein